MKGGNGVAGQTITLHLPDDLYNRVKQYAEQRQRSIEEELLEVVASAVPQDDARLPDDLADELAQLGTLDDAALWRVARSRFPRNAAARLESLHLQRQRNGLNAEEEVERERLLRQYERAMLLRAQATAILAERGHDVGPLAPKP
jgi:hypothetical protein